MTIRNTVGTFAAGVVSTASTVVRHPVCSAARAAGLVKGATGASVDLLRSRLRGDATAPGATPSSSGVPRQRAASDAGPEAPAEAPAARERDLPGPDVVARAVPDPDDLPEPIVIEALPEGEVGEAFHTEPKAASRDSEHGGTAGDREEADGYLEEIPYEDEDTPVWTSETPASGTGEDSVLDEAAVHAVRSESEMLRQAAERDPG